MKKLVTLIAFALVAYTGNAQLIINGDLNYDGDLNITDVMKMIDIILGNSPKSYLSCPDDNHPHIIDLGLPSGTKWACCNVGASTPEEYGGYYAWGETDVKDEYSIYTYQYVSRIDEDGDGIYNVSWQNIGSDIAGTQYDVAHVKWGGSWVMPTHEQLIELQNNCIYTWTIINGVFGGQFAGPSGGSIFLPAAGRKNSDSEDDGTGFNGEYWSSTQDPWKSNGANGLSFAPYLADWYGWSHRYSGCSVRAVFR